MLKSNYQYKLVALGKVYRSNNMDAINDIVWNARAKAIKQGINGIIARLFDFSTKTKYQIDLFSIYESKFGSKTYRHSGNY
jgi:hypothetical protein